MNTINVHTKISHILKQSPEALEAIISISPKFNKLRNPLLRKLMASRTSIATASRIGGCTVQDFFAKLKPLGFHIDDTLLEENEAAALRPTFMDKLSDQDVHELDVREMLESGKDPFQLILKNVNELQEHQVLKLINTFEPVPLIDILVKKRFETYTDTIDANLVYTYFYKTAHSIIKEPSVKNTALEWDKMIQKYGTMHLKYIDVRTMEMPLPMITILDELEKLPKGDALFVYHKRIPVFLLPELQERNFEYLIQEVSDDNVHLLIFHPEYV